MILSLLLFALALGAASPSDEVKQQPPWDTDCPMFWDNFFGICYRYVATRMTWADAELYCVSQGGNLVSINKWSEDAIVTGIIKIHDPAESPTWIGLSDIHKEGSWTWSDGSPVDFVSWDEEQPSDSEGRENCAHFGENRKWNDDQCSSTHAFVCKTLVPCNRNE